MVFGPGEAHTECILSKTRSPVVGQATALSLAAGCQYGE